MTSNWLMFCMCFFDRITYSPELLLLCLYIPHLQDPYVEQVDLSEFDNVHSVNLAELFSSVRARTCHTRLLRIFIEQVLECDSRQSLAFSLLTFTCSFASIA